MPPFRHTPAPHPIKRFSALKAPAEVPSSKPRQSRRMVPGDGLGQRQQDRARQRTDQGTTTGSLPFASCVRSSSVGSATDIRALRRMPSRCAWWAMPSRKCGFASSVRSRAQRRRRGMTSSTGDERRAAKSLLKACGRRQWLLSDGADVVLALRAYGRGAMLIPALRKRSAANATNQSTLAALAMASRFSTASGAAPISSFFTGSSIFLPDSVRGIAATA